MSGWEVQFCDSRRARLVRLFIGVLLLVLPVAFFGGRWLGAAGSERSAAEASRQAALIEEQNAELARLRIKVEVLKSGERLGRQAIEQSRQTIKLLEEQVFKQQQDIAFYKGVVAPESKMTEDLKIHAFKVQGTDNPQRFRYKVLLSRLGKDNRKLDGRLRVRIHGQLARKNVSYDLEQLSPGLSKTGLPISLRHFQSIPKGDKFAELELPKNFIPKQIEVRAELSGRSKPLERRFSWSK